MIAVQAVELTGLLLSHSRWTRSSCTQLLEHRFFQLRLVVREERLSHQLQRTGEEAALIELVVANI